MYRCSVESSIYVTGIGALTSEECAGWERVNSTNHLVDHLDPLEGWKVGDLEGCTLGDNTVKLGDWIVTAPVLWIR